MGVPVSRIYSAAFSVPGPQQAVNLDVLPFAAATLGVAILDGQASYSVEFTLDDVNNSAIEPVWFTFEEFPVGTSVTRYTATYYPIAFVRVNLEALTGTVAFKVSNSATSVE